MTLTIATIVGIVALAALSWLFVQLRSKDHLDEMMARRSPSVKLVSRANYVEGLERIPVALSLGNDSIFYENPDLEAKLELRQIEEVEYDDETATGQAVVGKALRLRSHGHTFEFVVDNATAQKWQSMLPVKRLDQGTARAV